MSGLMLIWEKYMLYIKRLWILELWIAIFLIQVTGSLEMSYPYKESFWNFGFPVHLFYSKAFVPNQKTAFSTKLFCKSIDLKEHTSGSFLEPNTGVFFWENLEIYRKNRHFDPIYIEFFYLPFHYQDCLVEGMLYTPKCKGTFANMLTINLGYVSLLSIALFYLYRKPFTRHSIRWWFLLIYTQIMILSWFFSAYYLYGNTNFFCTGNQGVVPGHRFYNWFWYLLESLNYIAVIAFILCFFEWINCATIVLLKKSSNSKTP